LDASEGACTAARGLIALYNRSGCTIPCFPRKAMAVVHPRLVRSAAALNSEQPQEKARTQGICPMCREAKQGGDPADEETFAPIAATALTITLVSWKRGVGVPTIVRS
jgi:hypothetical protein